MLVVVLCLAVAARASPPHVWFIVVDDLGWGGNVMAPVKKYVPEALPCPDVSFRGAEYATPHIDALAQEGVILDNYYVQARRAG